MQIDERTVGDVMVLDVKGKVTLGEGDEMLKDKVNSLVNQGHKKIVLNLAETGAVDVWNLSKIQNNLLLALVEEAVDLVLQHLVALT